MLSGGPPPMSCRGEIFIAGGVDRSITLGHVNTSEVLATAGGVRAPPGHSFRITTLSGRWVEVEGTSSRFTWGGKPECCKRGRGIGSPKNSLGQVGRRGDPVGRLPIQGGHAAWSPVVGGSRHLDHMMVRAAPRVAPEVGKPHVCPVELCAALVDRDDVVS